MYEATQKKIKQKKNLSISNQHVSTISWSCFKSVKSKFTYFWQEHAEQHLKIILRLRILEKNLQLKRNKY